MRGYPLDDGQSNIGSGANFVAELMQGRPTAEADRKNWEQYEALPRDRQVTAFARSNEPMIYRRRSLFASWRG